MIIGKNKKEDFPNTIKVVEEGQFINKESIWQKIVLILNPNHLINLFSSAKKKLKIKQNSYWPNQ